MTDQIGMFAFTGMSAEMCDRRDRPRSPEMRRAIAPPELTRAVDLGEYLGELIQADVGARDLPHA